MRATSGPKKGLMPLLSQGLVAAMRQWDGMWVGRTSAFVALIRTDAGCNGARATCQTHVMLGWGPQPFCMCTGEWEGAVSHPPKIYVCMYGDI